MYMPFELHVHAVKTTCTSRSTYMCIYVIGALTSGSGRGFMPLGVGWGWWL